MPLTHTGSILGRPHSLSRTWSLAGATLEDLGISAPCRWHVCWSTPEALDDLAEILPPDYDGLWLELERGPTAPEASAVWMRHAAACQVEWLAQGPLGGLRLSCNQGPALFGDPEAIWAQADAQPSPWIWTWAPRGLSPESPPFQPRPIDEGVEPPVLLSTLQQRCAEEAGQPGEIFKGRGEEWALIIPDATPSPALLRVATEILGGPSRGRWRWMGSLDVLKALWAARQEQQAPARAGLSSRHRPGALDELAPTLLDHPRLKGGMRSWSLWWPDLRPLDGSSDTPLRMRGLIARGQRRSHLDRLEIATDLDDPTAVVGRLHDLPRLAARLAQPGAWRYEAPQAAGALGHDYEALQAAIYAAIEAAPDVALDPAALPQAPSKLHQWWQGITGESEADAWFGMDARRVLPEALPGLVVDRQRSVDAWRPLFQAPVDGAHVQIQLARQADPPSFTVQVGISPWPIPFEDLEPGEGRVAPGISLPLEALLRAPAPLRWIIYRRAELDAALKAAAAVISAAAPKINAAAAAAAAWRDARGEQDP